MPGLAVKTQLHDQCPGSRSGSSLTCYQGCLSPDTALDIKKGVTRHCTDVRPVSHDNLLTLQKWPTRLLLDRHCRVHVHASIALHLMSVVAKPSLLPSTPCRGMQHVVQRVSSSCPWQCLAALQKCMPQDTLPLLHLDSACRMCNISLWFGLTAHNRC